MPIKNDKNKEIIPTKGLWAGDPGAPVSLVFFGDYESEECAKVHRVMVKLLESHGKKIRLNYRHFPMTQIHQHAHKAAEAAVAAAQEGKFWEMHNLLYMHRRRLGTISLREYAREAGVTSKNFLPDLVESKYGWTVRTDLLEGLDRGVRSVPTLLINDRVYQGRLSQPEIAKAIELECHSVKRKRA
ncbi:disulfide bond formation protein DsbA [Niastella caeni]|uniref:Disulfide bond formation protein DsbA n=1 Tax=Niastella caeni TaxID=2569763 RepID=A0A4V4H0B4_9BACT|nr:thioredoxin domain-containing protein [Niastella caeni]THU35896.1 disulfide bond formation protein DsbA [Niastella caeni]